MFVVEEGGWDCGYEELRAIGIWTSIRHRQKSRFRMLMSKILVIEFAQSINTSRARAITIQEITTLTHEILDNAMEFAAFVSLRSTKMILGFAGTKLPEIFSRLGNYIGEELKLDSTEWLTSNCDIKED